MKAGWASALPAESEKMKKVRLPKGPKSPKQKTKGKHHD
jgi:hypothetical protein